MYRKVFLAGATGAIGKRLVPLLLDAGYEVFGTTRSGSKAAGLQAAGATPIVVDVFDARVVLSDCCGSSGSRDPPTYGPAFRSRTKPYGRGHHPHYTYSHRGNTESCDGGPGVGCPPSYSPELSLLGLRALGHNPISKMIRWISAPREREPSS